MSETAHPGDRDAFVARKTALDALAADVALGEILTITGPPGAGKSRWAAELLRHPLLALHDGAWWADLDQTAEAALAERVALAVGAPTSPGVPAEASTLRHLRSAQGVLVLDGCDEIRQEAGQLVELIRRRCPGVRLVVTARLPLGIAAERVRSTSCGSSSVDRPAITGLWRQEDAVELLRRRGGSRTPVVDGQIDSQICRAIAGLPLAIELVAARAVCLPHEEILDQLRLARAAARTPPDSSESLTLEEVISWSCGSLSAVDRRILGRLSTFAGDFSAVDADAVAGEGLPPGGVARALARLTEAALVRSHVTETAEELPAARFRLPAPIRRFAADELARSGESSRVHDRYAAYWAQLAAVAERSLQSRQQAIWVQRLEANRNNLHAALQWLVAGSDVERALQMAGSLGRFWWLAGRFDEGWRTLRSILARPEACRRTVGRAAAVHALGLATFWHETDDRRARHSGACFEEAVSIYRELGERHRLVWALRDLGSHHNGAGDLERARALFAQSLEAAREVGDVAATGVAASYLGIAASYAGERAEARQRFEEAVILLSGRGGADELVRAHYYLACLECDDGNPTAARARFRAMVDGNAVVPTLPYTVGFALDGLARLAAAEQRWADALRLSGAAAAAHAHWGTSGGGAYAVYLARGLAEARQAVGPDATAAYVAEGSRWTIAQAVSCGFRPPAEAVMAVAQLRPRELQVLRMVDGGLGDAEIAARLFVSRRTVGNHLASVYRKLGVRSRTAALHVVRRHGLLAP